MFVLDTDHLSLLQWPDSAPGHRIWQRICEIGSGRVLTTIITYEEQSRGWLSYKGRARTITEELEAYRLLRKHLENYRTIDVLDFDQEASWGYQRLQRLSLRIGSMDLKIAAIVLVHGATLLSRNLQHFRQIPGLKVEDWAV